MPVGDGYNCPICGAYIWWSTPHCCGGTEAIDIAKNLRATSYEAITRTETAEAALKQAQVGEAKAMNQGAELHDKLQAAEARVRELERVASAHGCFSAWDEATEDARALKADRDRLQRVVDGMRAWACSQKEWHIYLGGMVIAKLDALLRETPNTP